MKLLYTAGAIALMFSSIICANEVKSKDCIQCIAFSCETISLHELLPYVKDAVWQLIDADEESSQDAFYELKEGLKIVYALNCLHLEEASTILQILDECYVALADAADRHPNSDILAQSLLLFTSGRNYEHETLAVQSLRDWTDTAPSNDLKSAIEATDADFVYIQENVSWNIQEDTHMLATHTPSHILYSTHPFRNSSAKILIIKHSKNKSNDSEYSVKGGVEMKLGGKDHGKTSLYFEGEVKDKDGNYAKGRVSKEKESDGYDCGVEAGKEKKKK